MEIYLGGNVFINMVDNILISYKALNGAYSIYIAGLLDNRLHVNVILWI